MIMGNRLDLSSLVVLDGFIGACVVDEVLGDVLGSCVFDAEIDLVAAAKAYVQVMQVKRQTVSNPEVRDQIQDILVALDTQYHLLRPFEGHDAFLYLVLERRCANLGMARHVSRQFEDVLAARLGA